MIIIQIDRWQVVVYRSCSQLASCQYMSHLRGCPRLSARLILSLIDQEGLRQLLSHLTSSFARGKPAYRPAMITVLEIFELQQSLWGGFNCEGFNCEKSRRPTQIYSSGNGQNTLFLANVLTTIDHHQCTINDSLPGPSLIRSGIKATYIPVTNEY